jgi:hypothetical protein
MARKKKPTHGGARANAGVKPQRGEPATVAVTVRFTDTEAERLDTYVEERKTTRAALALKAVLDLIG